MPTKLKALTCACAALFAASVLVLALPQRAAGQDVDDPPSRVARLSYMQGSVSFQPAGESDWVLATLNRPLTTGDKLWVDSGSRAELHMGLSAIRLGSNTGFSFLNLDDRTMQIQLSAGTLYIRVRHLGRDDNFEVDTPNQAFSLMRPGRYRIDASEDGLSTMVAVRDGQGEASGADRTYTVESGHRATLTGGDSLNADIDRINGRDRDDFDEWCEARDRRDERSRSMRYVSPELVGYEDLDDNGVWRHDFEYGDIWVPTAIPAGWAPYRYGHWAWISPWGWTWVDDAAWGYAPFHYGRWVYTRRTWAWVPGPVGVTPVYAPALVAFVGTPHFSVSVGIGEAAAVGWFPLGPREVYVPSYQVSREYVNRVNVSNTTVNSTTVTNVYNTTVINNVNSTHVTQINYVNRTAPGGVTAVPEGTFRSAQPVARAAVTVNEREMRDAPVVTRAEVAPTRNSVMGASENRGRTGAAPPARFERPVVAKTAPPPPPVSFERQASALATHPGRPLAHSEVETLRPVNMESAHPMVKQTPAREQETDRNRQDVNRPDKGRSIGEPGANAGRPNGQPANDRSGAFGNRPVNATPAEIPSQNTPRNDRPLSAQPEYRGRQGNQPDAQPDFQPGNGPSGNGPKGNVQPAKGQPAYAQPAREPAQPVNTSTAPSNIPPRNDRPVSAQPDYRGRPGNQPDAQPGFQPGNGRQGNGQPRYEQPNNQSTGGQPAGGQPAQSVSPATGPANMPSRNDRPGSAQPEYRPLSNRPPSEQSNYQPPAGQTSAQPSVQPSNRPTQQPNAQPVPPANNRFSNTQPNYQPPSPGNRPNPGAAPSAPSVQPRVEPPPSAPANRPVNVPAASAPAPEPRRNAAPNPPPPPPPPAAAPRPAPPTAAPPAPAPPAPTRNESPAAGRAPSAPPQPANKGGNAPGHDNKDDKKKN